MKLIKLLSLFLFVLIGFSCTKMDSDESHETVKINLLPTVGINQDSYTPLRSSNVVDTVYAVQIYEEGTPYYYGLFNDVKKMSIALTTNKKYTIKVASYQNGSGSGLKSLIQNGITSYYLPDSLALLNKFFQGDKLKGISSVKNVKLKDNKNSQYPQIDVLYQESDVTVTKGMSSVEIPLKRTGFGLGISVDGLTTGKIDVFFAGDTIHLTPTNNSYFSIRSFAGGENGLIDVAKEDSYFENSDIRVKWTGTNGSIVSASKTIKLKRNYQLPLSLNLNTSNQNLSIEGWYGIPANGLVAWYPFNGNGNDESGKGKNGTVNGAVLTTDRNGNVNSAYSFDGIDDFISTNLYGPEGTAERTISFWAKPLSTVTSEGYVIGYGSKLGGEAFSVNISYSGQYFRTDICGSCKIYTNKSVRDYWHFYTIVLPALTTPMVQDVIMYMDGVLLTSFTYKDQTLFRLNTVNTIPLNIGRSLNTGDLQNFKGSIDDIGVWNRALTKDEVLSLYNYR